MERTVDRFARLAALKPARGGALHPAVVRPPDEEDPVARLLGAGIARNHYGEHLSIRNWFSTPEFAAPSRVALELLTRAVTRKQRSLRGKAGFDKRVEDPEQWLFLDTETTGLAGGTGTYAFLVGLAWWDSGGLQVEQMFLRDFSQEHSLLLELAARLTERPVLVTFNGKTFDWPLLESRFTMTRAIQAPKLAAHLDLLHPARALWKLRLGSVKLVELERQVLDAQRLGWYRGDDISSALIPQYYFDYLRGGSPDPLARVVRHNQLDLRGLAALSTRINALLDTQGSLEEEESVDLFGLSRYLDRRGERERAQATCAKALDAGLPAEFRARATRDLAQRAKREGNRAAAATLWEQLTHDPADGLHACDQLAIYYERHAIDLVRALEYAELALAKLMRQGHNLRDPLACARRARKQEKLMCRVERLRHRIGRVNAAPLLTRTSGASTAQEEAAAGSR